MPAEPPSGRPSPEELTRRASVLRAAAPHLGDWITFRAAHQRTVGVQFALRTGTDLVLDGAWGLADVGTGEPLTTDHLFRIASHSKTFAATLVLQQVERGRLRLDDAVADLVPELAGSPVADRTVRELLGHQGGVRRDGRDADFWELGGPFPDRDALLAEMHAAGAVYERNEHFKYSNLGYGLLGLVLEAVTGHDFAALVATDIAGPLGLHRTGGELDPVRADEYAAGHTGLLDADDRRTTIEHVDTRALAAATGCWSTARDLTGYGIAHCFGDERLLTDSSKRVMQRLESIVSVRGEEVGRYGVGVDLRTLGERQLVGHSGGYPGHITRTFIDPVQQLVVSVLTNAIDGPAEQLAVGLLQLVDLALDPPADAGQHAPGRDGLPPASAYTGRFASLWGVTDVVELGGRLVLVHPAHPEPRGSYDELQVVGPDELRIAPGPGFGSAGESVSMTRSGDGSVTSIRVGGVTSVPLEEFRTTRAAFTRRRPVGGVPGAAGTPQGSLG